MWVFDGYRYRNDIRSNKIINSENSVRLLSRLILTIKYISVMISNVFDMFI